MRDDARIIRYGEPALWPRPNDVMLLDRVSRALLDAGGKENADARAGLRQRFEDYVIRVPVPAGYDRGKEPGGS